MTLPQALLAGAAGTVALRAFVALRNRVLGRPPPYAARHITTRLARSVLRGELSSVQARRWGDAMRAVYGPLLGVAWMFVRETASGSPAPPGLVLGVGVLGFELATFPVLNVTEPLRTWSAAEHGWLVAQTAVYGLVTEAALAILLRGLAFRARSLVTPQTDQYRCPFLSGGMSGAGAESQGSS